MSLTPKQTAFVQEYLIDLNATQAAIRAGYSVRTANRMGSENLSKPDIAVAVQQAMAERSERTGVVADRVLLELARVAFSDMGKVAKWGPGGVQVLDSEEIPGDVRLAVAEVASTDTKYGRTMRVKLHDKLRALELLGKHLDLFGGDGGGGGEPDPPAMYWKQRDPRSDLRIIDQPPVQSNGSA